MYCQSKRFLLLPLILACTAVLGVPASNHAYQQHQVFFQNTDHELNIYRIYGEEPGKTLLIIAIEDT